MLQVIETLVEWLKLINDGDVADLVDLVKTLYSVLHELSKVHGRLNCVGYTLDDDGVVSALGAVEQLPGSLEVSTDTNSSSNSNFVSGKGILWFVHSSISVGHFSILVKLCLN